MEVRNLLQGAYDLHVHTAPDVVPRKVTDIEIAKRLSGLGMKGYAIKSHQFNTAGRAAIVNELFPGFNAVGCVPLNPAMGGFNPAAVEMAGRYGAKIIWFPTVGSKNEADFLRRTGRSRSYGAGAAPLVDCPPLTVFDDSGRLLPEVVVILDLIKRYDMVMATGHVSKEEALALVKAGRDMGVRKITVTHPDFPECYATPAEQTEYAKFGAMIEYCYHTVWSGTTSYDTLDTMIRTVGVERVFITSDLGQTNTPDPEIGFIGHVGKLMERGFSEKDIRRMIVDNPKFLVE